LHVLNGTFIFIKIEYKIKEIFTGLVLFLKWVAYFIALF
jgi:hypothetical protein